jgi:hypothetical protein
MEPSAAVTEVSVHVKGCYPLLCLMPNPPLISLLSSFTDRGFCACRGFPHPFFSSMPNTLAYHIYMDLPEAVREVSVQQGSGDFPPLCSSAIPLLISRILRYSIFFVT